MLARCLNINQIAASKTMIISARKPLVLCADDYAQDVGVSSAIRQLAAQGRLSATSVMVLAPRWPADAAPLRELHERVDVGLHLDFTSDFARAAGHGLPLGAAMRRALLGGFDRRAARAAIARQLDAFEAQWGGPPDHIDGHQHVLQFAGIREPLVELLAHRYPHARPWLRISRAPAGQRDAKSRVIAWLGADVLEALAAQAGLPCAPALLGIYDFRGGVANYARRMARWLMSAPRGTLLMCHPGIGASNPGDAIAAARRWELTHLQSALFAEQLASINVELVRGSRLYTV